MAQCERCYQNEVEYSVDCEYLCSTCYSEGNKRTLERQVEQLQKVVKNLISRLPADEAVELLITLED